MDLSNHELTSLPESIGNLKYLDTLKLDGNQLTSLPESIGNLTNLKELDLYGNQLTSLPESIGNLENLDYLSLSNNQFTSLPESIGNLKNLDTLDLTNNQLTNIPESIGNLAKLRYLFMRYNQYTSIPESIHRLNLTTFLWDDVRGPVVSHPVVAPRNIPRNAENAITMNAIQNGNNMVNFHGEYNLGRYYKKGTYNSFREPKKNPYTRRNIASTNAVQYKAKVGGRRLRSTRRHNRTRK